jgi:uncharacterized protein (DUF362 family)
MTPGDSEYMERAKGHVTKVEQNAEDMTDKMQRVVEWLNVDSMIGPGDHVFIKPNLTYPTYKQGVTTSPRVIESLVKVLVNQTTNVTIVESDGGSHAWQAEEAFKGHKVYEICSRYGAKSLNLSKAPSKVIQVSVADRRVKMELPSPLLDDADLFITLPVPKVHVMTGVSLAFKNQWGCIGDVKRLRYHPVFAHAILGINKLFTPSIAIFDGTYFLNRTGPMDGDPIAMNLLVASNDLGAGSLLCCEIMGIDPSSIHHLRLARQVGMMPGSLADIDLNTDISRFCANKFTLERTALNWVALAAFQNRLLTWLLYDSFFSKPIHELLYLMRGRPQDMTPEW